MDGKDFSENKPAKDWNERLANTQSYITNLGIGLKESIPTKEGVQEVIPSKEDVSQMVGEAKDTITEKGSHLGAAGSLIKDQASQAVRSGYASFKSSVG